MALRVSTWSKKAGTGKKVAVARKASAIPVMIDPAYGMPEVLGLAAPFSCTTVTPVSGRGSRWETTAETVVPHATPTTWPGSTHSPSSRAATRATASRRRSSPPDSATTWACTSNASPTSRARSSVAEWSGASETRTSPLSRAAFSSRETVERETRSRLAIASIVSPSRW